MRSISSTDQSLHLRTQMLHFKNELNKEATLKGLLALAGLVAGVAIMIFLSAQFLPFAIGLIVISSYSLYHQIQNCRDANRDFNREATQL